MKTFLIAAITADGFIAKHVAHSTLEWRSKDDKKFFTKQTRRAGVVVLGANTCKTMRRPMPERRNIVYSEQPIEGYEITQKNPKELLQELESQGFKEIAICGGAQIYTMFMEAELIDTLYLTVEPILFGSGIKLFNKELDTKLQLKSTRKLNESTILLEYDVVKER